MLVIVVVGAVEESVIVMTGFRFDFNVMLIVFVVDAAGSAPGAETTGLVTSPCGLGDG